MEDIQGGEMDHGGDVAKIAGPAAIGRQLASLWSFRRSWW
jgi:hypothetical protein